MFEGIVYALNNLLAMFSQCRYLLFGLRWYLCALAKRLLRDRNDAHRVSFLGRRHWVDVSRFCSATKEHQNDSLSLDERGFLWHPGDPAEATMLPALYAISPPEPSSYPCQCQNAASPMSVNSSISLLGAAAM